MNVHHFCLCNHGTSSAPMMMTKQLYWLFTQTWFQSLQILCNHLHSSGCIDFCRLVLESYLARVLFLNKVITPTSKVPYLPFFLSFSPLPFLKLQSAEITLSISIEKLTKQTPGVIKCSHCRNFFYCIQWVTFRQVIHRSNIENITQAGCVREEGIRFLVR